MAAAGKAKADRKTRVAEKKQILELKEPSDSLSSVEYDDDTGDDAEKKEQDRNKREIEGAAAEEYVDDLFMTVKSQTQSR